MNTWRQPIPKGISAKLGLVLGLSLSWMVFAPHGQPQAAIDERVLPPFLDVFRENREPPVVTRKITFPSAVGPVNGFLARQETKERLPGVLVIPGKEGLSEWMEENTRDLASIGYVVLALDLRSKRLPASTPTAADSEAVADEPTLARLSAAVRWLRRRPEVLPDRIGLVGWFWGGSQALALAASASVQACVICDGEPIHDAAIIAGLRNTAVLGIFAGKEKAASKSIRAFEQALADSPIVHRIKVYEGAGRGFMGPPNQPSYVHQAADKAFVEIYEFLGKYVEDAPANALQVGAGSSAAESSVLAIADIMLAVNAPDGVRGTLMKTLEKDPANQAQWDRVRANAALIAEAGKQLQNRRPPKGKLPDWQEQTRAYTAIAESMVTAADRRDSAKVRNGLKDLASRCTSCHEKHR